MGPVRRREEGKGDFRIPRRLMMKTEKKTSEKNRIYKKKITREEAWGVKKTREISKKR